MTAASRNLTHVRQFDSHPALDSLSTIQQIRNVLEDATQNLPTGSAADNVLKQFEGALTSGPLLCIIAVHRRDGRVEQLPDFDSVNWHAQAVASLAAARVFESQAEDLKTASSQLTQMFLPGYQRSQLQRSRRAMLTLLRCLRFCLTSEGQQAVLAAVICLVALQIFADDTAALQAVTREAAYSLGKNRSSVSQLAAWAITSLACRSKADCNIIAVAGGSSVLVNQLQYQPLEALESLGEMAELHAELVWDSLLTFSGLTKLVDQTKAFDLHNEAGLTALSRLIRGLHKLVQHPHNQAAVLQELKSSEALELSMARDASQLWSVEPVIDFAFERPALSSPHAQPGTAPALLSQQQRLDSTPASDLRADSELLPNPSRSALLPQRAPPPPTRDQAMVPTGSTDSPVSFRAEAHAAPLESIVSQRPSSSEVPIAPLLSYSPVGGGHVMASPGSQHSPSSSVTQKRFPSAQDYVHGSAPDPTSGSYAHPYPSAEVSSPTKFSSGPRRTDSLEYIQSWLDTNPEGQWSPFPFSHQPSPVKSQPEGLERQTPAQQVPPTQEAKRPAQRALQFSPMSVTQPGAEVMHAHLGKIPSLEDAYLRKRKLSKGPNPAHEDSAWGSFDPQVAWSASGSSLVTTPRLESATSCDTQTHTGNHSVATIDNISKPSVDSPSRLSVETATRSPSHTPREIVAAADKPALARTSKTSSDLPGNSAVTPANRLSLDGHSPLPVGKGKKLTKILTWLTDPDTRDAARAKKSGKPVKRGALYDLATPIGRCLV
ncbi:hypothetical protein WJX79_004679 [Trebouxia sp. C0005]